MHAGTGLLAIVGGVCMMLALVLAWCLARVRSSQFVKKCFPNPQYWMAAARVLEACGDFLQASAPDEARALAPAVASKAVRSRRCIIIRRNWRHRKTVEAMLAMIRPNQGRIGYS